MKKTVMGPAKVKDLKKLQAEIVEAEAKLEACTKEIAAITTAAGNGDLSGGQRLNQLQADKALILELLRVQREQEYAATVEEQKEKIVAARDAVTAADELHKKALEAMAAKVAEVSGLSAESHDVLELLQKAPALKEKLAATYQARQAFEKAKRELREWGSLHGIDTLKMY